MEKINVITLCSGYDSQCMALQRIKKDFGLDYDLIAWSEIDKYASYPDSKTRRGRVQGGGKICPTLTAQGETPCYYEGKEVIEDDAGALSGTCKEIEWRGKKLNDGDGLYTGTSEGFFRGGLKGISRTIKAGTSDAGVVENYRIRKLTERECFRLMGVTDADIDKIKSAGISRTQQYRMAGNSIVVDVLYHIFRKMFIDKTTIQLTLF